MNNQDPRFHNHNCNCQNHAQHHHNHQSKPENICFTCARLGQTCLNCLRDGRVYRPQSR